MKTILDNYIVKVQNKNVKNTDEAINGNVTRAQAAEAIAHVIDNSMF